jgi:hypothetical protein
MGYATTQIAIYGIEIEGYLNANSYEGEYDPDNRLDVLHSLIFDYDKDTCDLIPRHSFPLYVDGSFEIKNAARRRKIHEGLITGEYRFLDAQRHFLDGVSAKEIADRLKMDEKEFVRQVKYIEDNNITVREERYQIVLEGDGADSRISDEDSGVDTYAFGIFLASKGYGCQDKLSDYTKPVNPIVIQRWNEYCVPLLNKAGIKVTEPEVVRISQVW